MESSVKVLQSSTADLSESLLHYSDYFEFYKYRKVLLYKPKTYKKAVVPKQSGRKTLSDIASSPWLAQFLHLADLTQKLNRNIPISGLKRIIPRFH